MGEKSGEACDEHGGRCGSYGKVLHHGFRYAHVGEENVEQRDDDERPAYTEEAGEQSHQRTAADENKQDGQKIGHSKRGKG